MTLRHSAGRRAAPAAIRRLPQYGACRNTAPAAIRRLPQYGACRNTAPAAIRRLPQYGACRNTAPAAIRRLPQYGACRNTALAYPSFIAAAAVVTTTAATPIVIMILPPPPPRDSGRPRAPTTLLQLHAGRPATGLCSSTRVRMLPMPDPQRCGRAANGICRQHARHRTRDPASRCPNAPLSPLSRRPAPVWQSRTCPMKHLIRLWLEFALCAYCSSTATA